MSLTERERHNPPPRQKSCAACIKAKRRCDAALPACLRCAQRGIPCVMPARRAPARGRFSFASSSAAAPAPYTVASSITSSASSASPPTPPPPPTTTTQDLGDFMDAAFPLTQTAGPTEWECFLSSLDPVFTSKSLDYTGSTPPGGLGIEETTCVDMPPPLPQPGNFLPCPLETTQPDLLELIHQPSALAAPTTKTLDPMPDAVSRKLSYALDEIKKVPAMMVLETQTPWCHPRLYEEHMPRSMQDAHAACALYMAKNRANARVILRSIDARASDLIASPPPTDPLGILARTQSLILYHIIRVFDGDIAARAAAEDTQSALEDAAMELILHTDFDCPSPAKLAAAAAVSSNSSHHHHHHHHQLPLQPFGPTKRFFQDWVFQESARRTLLFIFFFLQAYRIIRGQRVEACDGRLNRCHAFTLSAALWEADGPLAFARAWGARRHLVVENTNFQIAFQEARADEIDAFGRIMLTSVIGVDEAEGWFAARGGSLRGSKVAV